MMPLTSSKNLLSDEYLAAAVGNREMMPQVVDFGGGLGAAGGEGGGRGSRVASASEVAHVVEAALSSNAVRTGRQVLRGRQGALGGRRRARVLRQDQPVHL